MANEQSQSIDWLAFCDKENMRYAMSAPWVKDGWKFATNLRVMVAVPTGEPDSPPSQDGRRFANALPLLDPALDRQRRTPIAFRYLKGEAGRKVQRIESPKPEFVAKLVRDEVASGLSVLVWTIFDAEGDILSEQLTKFGVDHSMIDGSTSDADRADILDQFQSETCRVLISKASMIGFGLNFQHVGSMIFSGWNDSFEAYYQALRRAYRYGQTKKLRVHIPVIADLEGDMLETIFEKEAKHLAAIEETDRTTANVTT